MSQTANAQCSVPTPKFNENTFQILTNQVQEHLIAVGLLGGLYGVLAVLSIQSIHALMQRGKRTQHTAVILCSTILALFTSTTIYVVIFILFYQSDFLRGFIMAADNLWLSFGVIGYPTDGPLRLVRDYSKLEACVGTASLTINVTLGDAIVCWRASTVWHKNRTVRTLCIICVLITLALGAVATSLGCHPTSELRSIDSFSAISYTGYVGTLYEGLPIGLVTCMLSFSTNLMATILVGYKAWISRRRLRGYLVAGSQVEKLLALLIESGAVYCAIWGTIVAFQICQYLWWQNPTRPWQAASAEEISFFNVFAVLMNGALVPAIAIYPAVIIVLVALNRSHVEKGLTPHLDSLLTPHITNVTVDPIPKNLRDDRPHSEESDRTALSIEGHGLSAEIAPTV